MLAPASAGPDHVRASSPSYSSTKGSRGDPGLTGSRANPASRVPAAPTMPVMRRRGERSVGTTALRRVDGITVGGWWGRTRAEPPIGAALGDRGTGNCALCNWVFGAACPQAGCDLRTTNAGAGLCIRMRRGNSLISATWPRFATRAGSPAGPVQASTHWWDAMVLGSRTQACEPKHGPDVLGLAGLAGGFLDSPVLLCISAVRRPAG